MHRSPSRTTEQPMRVVGLMSGTSADGTDVAVVEIAGHPPHLQWHLLHATTIPHPPELRCAILTAMTPDGGTVDRICELNVALGEQFAQAVLIALREADLHPKEVHLIGSHGQTLWHQPQGPHPGTLQIGEAAIIAERTGIPVVSNFRARDMAVGGQGAPLVAYVDVLLLTHETHVRAAQNIGGIANVTFLPPRGSPWTPIAFDTGPGNAILDEAAQRATEGAWQCDRGGYLAARGTVNHALLERWLSHPYFAQKPPKSTGRELFGQSFVERAWQEGTAHGLSPMDIVATLTALVAHSIARAYRDFFPVYPQEVILSGGGVHNASLMNLLRDLLAPARVLISDRIGIPADYKEALAFAVLAYETWHGRPGNLPAATGAAHRVILGDITPA